MIQKIKILEHNRIKKLFEFDCNPVNLIVGDQGTGKSTFLKLLMEHSEYLQIQHNIVEETPVYYFDTEKHNPRLKDPQEYSTPSGQDKGIGYKGGLYSRFQSHGEVMQEFTVKAIEKADEKCIVLLDEPESGLSLRNQYKLVKAIQEASKRDVQFFIATHCLPLIQAFSTVVSFEHGKVMKSQEFIKTQLKTILI